MVRVGLRQVETRPSDASKPQGLHRVAVEGVLPCVDAGRFPIKRVAGDVIVVEADVLTDGHDQVMAVVKHRKEGSTSRNEAPMSPIGNDRWRGTFPVPESGRFWYAVEAWIDRFGTWRHDLQKRTEAGQDPEPELVVGAELVRSGANRASGDDSRRLHSAADAMLDEGEPLSLRTALALGPELAELVWRYPDRAHSAISDPELAVDVAVPAARASAWYELFPRSWGSESGRHGTLREAEGRLAYVADLGFDVVYLPPIHPVGRTHRKGRNNQGRAGPDAVGSPWAIGSPEGGHKTVHPRLGTLEDFHRFVAAAKRHGLDVALDIAFQCSPDHPYVKEHPEWFRHRPDGTIRHAENPPKKYEDIYPFDFESSDWPALWDELKSIFEFWASHGIRRFRVDNPHTKPFSFWEWVIGEVKKKHPDVLFLSEAFTRPKGMYRLAKMGFDHSYTYFAWRNNKQEIVDYFTELSRAPVSEFFRPHLWPNTPDILTATLQTGGRAAFMTRFVLAATLGPNYGIYGPAFELMENRAVAPGSEEYLDSEKYELKPWDLARPDTLGPFITQMNRIRRENPALTSDRNLRFHGIDNDQLLAYSRRSPDGSNVVLVFVNLDPHHTHSGMADLDLGELGLTENQPYQVHDLLSGSRYLWRSPRNFVELRPHEMPAHVFRIRHHVRTEQDFDYYQ